MLVIVGHQQDQSLILVVQDGVKDFFFIFIFFYSQYTKSYIHTFKLHSLFIKSKLTSIPS